jgi:hypothetical protein
MAAFSVWSNSGAKGKQNHWLMPQKNNYPFFEIFPYIQSAST